MRGKGTKLSEGCQKVRLSQDRMAIFGIFTFGIVMLLYGSIRDFCIREDYVRDCFIREKFVAPASGQCYKTFYGRKLRLFIISYSAFPWQAFPA